MTRTPRLLLLFVTLLVTSAALAGCTQRDDGAGDDPAGTGDEADTVTLLLRGVESPEGADQAVVNMTVEHIAFYDATTNEWMPLLTSDADADVLFAEGDTETAHLTQVPLADGDHNAVEIVVNRARVVTDEGASDAEVPRVACYAPLSLGAQGDGATIEVELWISGSEALRQENGTWTFRPVLVGTDSSASEGDIEISEPDCMPF